MQQNQQHTEKSLSDPDEEDQDESGSQLSIEDAPKPQQIVQPQPQKDYNEETSSQEDRDDDDEDELPSESNYKEHVEKIRQSQLRDQALWANQRRDDSNTQQLQHSENHQSSRNEMQQFKDSEYEEADQQNTFAHSIHLENLKRQQKAQQQQVVSNMSKQHSQNSHNTFLAGGDQNKNISQMVMEQSNLSSNFNIMHVKPKMVEESNQPMVLDDPHQVIMSEIRHSQIESSKSLNQMGAEQYSSTSQRQIQQTPAKIVYDQYCQINIKPEQRDAENQVLMDSLKQQIRSELIDEVKRDQMSVFEAKQQEQVAEFQAQISKIQQQLFQKQQEFSDSKQLIQNLQ